MRGKFIIFEGTDGSGKSSVVEEVKKHLKVRSIPADFVCDPGGTAIGAQIRKILLARENAEMSALTELLLYCASRTQLVAEKIMPALAEGRHVISDRFIYSTLAYQGVSGKIDENTLRTLARVSTGGLEPAHAFLLDVPAEIGLKRAGKDLDRMESKGVCFLEEVRQRYLGMFDALPEGKATVIDATRPILEVTREVLEKIDGLLEL